MDKTESGRRRILFVAEAVTLAHVVRPLVLAQALHPERYEVHFACAEGSRSIFQGTDFTYWPIHSISGESFLHALATGARLYDYHTLNAYVEEDLRLLDAMRPDLVVGDFRLSLAVSAPLRNVPYVALANAHWSPYAVAPFPLPEHPLAERLGVTLAAAAFKVTRPFVFWYHARPMNVLRRRHGMHALGDLRRVYTHGDHTLYLDVPGLVPTSRLPANHHYIGPLLWSPDVDLPAWWDDLPADRPLVYVTLGSSGQVDVLPRVIDALAHLGVTALVATAGRAALGALPEHVRVADYLPGKQAAQRSEMVICNGGSATAYQALAEGKPVLGIPSNMDQYLTMECVERRAAGLMLRAGQVTTKAIREAVTTLLTDDSSKTAAKCIAGEFAQYAAPALFATLIEEWLQADTEPTGV